MIYLKKPENFNPKFEVVSCFVEMSDKILLLLRHDHKTEGGTWGVPAGKVENNEDIQTAMIRELKEETGLDRDPAQLKYFAQVYVSYPDYDFVYHMYSAEAGHDPDIHINQLEHKEFKWVSPRDALDMPLIPDEDHCIKMFYQI